MTIANEIPKSPNQFAGALRDGLDVLDMSATIPFLVYERTVLPLDGYVFWIPSVPVTVQGSLHYNQDLQQEEDETYGMAGVTLTTQTEFVAFSTLPVNQILVGTLPGGRRFAFSQQNGFYKQANLWHYFGYSIPPAMEAQLIDDPSKLDPQRAVVSNSLPFWLQLNNYTPFYGFGNATPVFPGFMVPTNQTGRYVSVSIAPPRTRALQPVPFLDATQSSWQLNADTVTVTLHNFQSDEAIDFLNCVLQYSVDTENIGLMNGPTIRDDQRKLAEIQTLAMRKFIDFEVSYYQARAMTVARGLIKKAFASYQIVEP